METSNIAAIPWFIIPIVHMVMGAHAVAFVETIAVNVFAWIWTVER